VGRGRNDSGRQFPLVGFEEIGRIVCSRLDLNHPPVSTGGIRRDSAVPYCRFTAQRRAFVAQLCKDRVIL
jgi:hypothetical protein